MLELNREWGEGSVAGKEIYIQAWLFDWKWEETLSGFSITQVIHDQVDVKLLGRRLRTFKPRTPTSLQVSSTPLIYVFITEESPWLVGSNHVIS